MIAVCAKSSRALEVSRVPPDTRNLVGIRGDHPPRLNITWWPIAYSTVRERWKEPRAGEWNRILKPQAYKQWEHNVFWQVWPRTFCIMSQRVIFAGKVKPLQVEPQRKRVWNGRLVCRDRPETRWSIHGQGEAWVILRGGPNKCKLKITLMSCG